MGHLGLVPQRVLGNRCALHPDAGVSQNQVQTRTQALSQEGQKLGLFPVK